MQGRSLEKKGINNYFQAENWTYTSTQYTHSVSEAPFRIMFGMAKVRNTTAFRPNYVKERRNVYA